MRNCTLFRRLCPHPTVQGGNITIYCRCTAAVGCELMQYEKSCGAIVFRKFHGNTELLLIKHANGGHWSFPKGHVEHGETEIQTATREVKEETGIDVMIDSSFREIVSYSSKKDTLKDVVYFLGLAKNFVYTPQPEEIAEIKWVEISRVTRILSYDNDRQLANKVKALIKYHY